jgi:bifunctional DNA-binding transcriptional regulator/antitoxin component of YhaV-PrlF toxin-antitoxin module
VVDDNSLSVRQRSLTSPLREGAMQTRLKVTSKGQVTLRKDLLDHLGVKPGDSVVVDLGRDGEATVKAAPKHKIERIFGILKNKNGIHLTVDEINEAIANAWAGQR